MPLTIPGNVAVGAPVLASQLDEILRATDERLGRLYSGSRSWWMFDTSSVPPSQVPPIGAVYVLSDDEDRELIPPPGSFPSPDHGGAWPKKYDRAAFFNAVAEMPVIGRSQNGNAWLVAGHPVVDVYGLDESLDILTRTATDAEGTLTLPAQFEGNYEPERFFRYAIADVFVESSAAGSYAWPFDKYGVVRFHNLGKGGATFEMYPEPPLRITVSAGRVTTIRRTGRNDSWRVENMRRYFPNCLSLDVPVWDGLPAPSSRPNRSQYANPIFRVALLQTMFTPNALGDAPGFYTSVIEDVLAPVTGADKLSKALVQNGDFDVVRAPLSFFEPGDTEVFTLSYNGEDLTTTPAAWAQIGLVTSVDPAHRGAYIRGNPDFPGPSPDYTWNYDFITRSTNLSGGIVAEQGAICPWFRDPDRTGTTPETRDDENATEWANSIFAWPEWSVVREVKQEFYALGHWEPTVPLTGALNEIYVGRWHEDDQVEARQYVADWGVVSMSTVPPWNMFLTQVSALLPTGGGRASPSLKRHPLFIAVVLTQEIQWHAPREDSTWDDESNIRPKPPRPGRPEGGPHFYFGDRTLGFGQNNSGELWREPMWQVGLLPTLGFDPQKLWDSLAMYGSEEIIWTQLIPQSSGAGTINHWRVKNRDGQRDGSPWTWNYTTKSEYPPIANEPTAEVLSGMSAWRVFSQSAKPSGSTETYPGKTALGPQPWKVRDHGWIADEILAGRLPGQGEPWADARKDCYDKIPIGGSGGVLRPDEFRVGMQIRMTAATLNGISALIRGMTHVRPLSWSQYRRGFDLEEISVGAGPSSGWAIALGGVTTAVQPYGCAYVYGQRPDIDAKMDELGVVRRKTTSPSLQALRNVAGKYFDDAGEIQPGPVPVDWLTAGDLLEWCSHDDIHGAMTAEGFSYNAAQFVQPVSIVAYGPDTMPQQVNDSFTLSGDVTFSSGGFSAPAVTFGPPLRAFWRIEKTSPLPVPDESTTPELQFAGYPFYRIAEANPAIRAQVHFKKVVLQATPPVYRWDVTTVGHMTGQQADSLERYWSDQFRHADPGTIVWKGRLIGRSGLAVDVMAVPWRFLVAAARLEDRTGSRALADKEYNVPLVLPRGDAHSAMLRVVAGDDVTVGELKALLPGTGTDWPDRHYVWELYINQPTLERLV
jgi:hypothetical protein